jgi:hypothetical protein
MNKREFVGCAGAVGALALLDGPLAVANVRGSTAVPALAAVILDERYSDARRFAVVLQGRGARRLATQRDVSRLWTGELDAIVTAAGALAGFTPHSDIMLMADWGARRNLRVRYLGMHDSRASGLMWHRLRTGADSSERIRSLDLNHAAWASTLARGLADTAFGGPGDMACTITTHQRPGGDFPGTLVSWVIA